MTSLLLNNDREIDVVLQINLVKWTQALGKDVYKPSSDLLFIPQIIKVPAHKSQTIRVAMDTASFGPVEQAYRLFVQEVLPNPSKKSPEAIQVAVRMGLPVVLQATTGVQEHISWQVKPLGHQKIMVKALNQGNNVVFIGSLRVLDGHKKPLSKSMKTFNYLLPGSPAEWIVTVDSSQSVKKIEAQTKSGVLIGDVG